jgi:hypothetical protein
LGPRDRSLADSFTFITVLGERPAMDFKGQGPGRDGQDPYHSGRRTRIDGHSSADFFTLHTGVSVQLLSLSVGKKHKDFDTASITFASSSLGNFKIKETLQDLPFLQKMETNSNKYTNASNYNQWRS